MLCKDSTIQFLKNLKYYKYFTNSIQKLCQIHYIQLITRLLVVNNIRNLPKVEESVLSVFLILL